jgi:hypothetical protein
MTAEQAIAIARETPIECPELVAADAWPKLAPGVDVTVTPQDYGAVPVTGSLLRLDHSEIAIRRQDSIAGEVVVHFPRLGYRVEAAR